MIVILHALCFLRNSLYATVKGLYSRHWTKKYIENDESYICEVSLPPRAQFDENGVKFSPPAYLQRYGDIYDILKGDSRWAGRIHKVVDFGCSELSFFLFLKKIPECHTILEVDFDGEVLEQFYRRAEPIFNDHIIQKDHPFKVLVLQGSVADPEPRLLKCDAVVAIELIEHLSPGALDRLPHNIFGYIQPRLVFITTPNVEFNVLFPNLRDGTFRHWDHRFEWTRSQFEDWAHNITVRYPSYIVEFSGIAPGPPGTEDLGCCSQMAVFINKDYVENTADAITKSEEMDVNVVPLTSETNCFSKCVTKEEVPEAHASSSTGLLATPSGFSWDSTNWMDAGPSCSYKTVAEYDYPFYVDVRTRDEKIFDEAILHVQSMANYNSDYFNEDEDCWEIPLKRLLHFLKELGTQEAELIQILVAKDFVIEDGMLIYRKLHNDSLTNENFSDPGEISSYMGDSPHQEEDWDNFYDASSWDAKSENIQEGLLNIDIAADGPKPGTSLNPIVLPGTQLPPQPKVKELSDACKADQTAVVPPHTPVFTSQLMESMASIPDEQSHSSSPLGQFYGPNRDLDDQRLSDSGYLKSQDSPQSPVCSDTFSNDLITPDKECSELQHSTILECIPENLHSITVQSAEPTSASESCRKSIGTGIGADSSKSLEHDTRPKSLHVCYACEDSIASKRKSDPDSPFEMKEYPALKSPQLELMSPEVIDAEMDERLKVENVPRHIMMMVGGRNQGEVGQHAYHLPDRLLRPDFLDIQILERVDVVNGDRLNNNLDYEGNNQEGREDVDEEYNGELLMQHLDRDNENHLIIDDNIIPARERGVIVENILEYREVNGDEDNDDFYNRLSDDDIYESLSNIQSPVYDKDETLMEIPEPITLHNKEMSFSSQEDFSEVKMDRWDSNNLLESIAQTLSLTSENQFGSNFPCCSNQLSTLGTSLSSDKFFSCSANNLSDVSIYRSDANLSIAESSMPQCDGSINIEGILKNSRRGMFSDGNAEGKIENLNMGIFLDDSAKNMFDILKTNLDADKNTDYRIDERCFSQNNTIDERPYNCRNSRNAENILHGIIDNVTGSGFPKPGTSKLEEQDNLDRNDNDSGILTSNQFYDIDLVEMSGFQTHFGADCVDKNTDSSPCTSNVPKNNESELTVDNDGHDVPHPATPAVDDNADTQSDPMNTLHDSSTYFFATDAVFPDWLLTFAAEQPEPGPQAEERQGGAGDGVGVHSLPSTTSSGVSSLNSNTSNNAQMDPSEDRSISSEELLLFSSTVSQSRDYYETSSSSSDITVNRRSGVAVAFQQPLADLVATTAATTSSSSTSSSKTGSRAKKRNLSYSLHVLTSDTSGNDADAEIESESE